jgi:hypothetical protein
MHMNVCRTKIATYAADAWTAHLGTNLMHHCNSYCGIAIVGPIGPQLWWQ